MYVYNWHESGAVKKILQQVCAETGADLHEAQLTLPLKNKQQVSSGRTWFLFITLGSW